jgi:hypothetical protein
MRGLPDSLLYGAFGSQDDHRINLRRPPRLDAKNPAINAD